MKLLTTSLLLAFGACLTGQAQLHPHERFAITTEQVAAKLVSTFAQKGVALDAKQVAVPGNVLSTEEAPALEVQSVETLGQMTDKEGSSTGSAVKLACENTRVCRPFYAVVRWRGNADASTPLSEAQQVTFTKATPTAPVIKSGARITLVMENRATHIQMSVISIESGGLHRQIKVRTADRKQTYIAEVLDANTVKGTF